MSIISELCEEHRRIEAHADRLRRIVSAQVPDAAAIASMRWQMGQVLHDHCAHEDREVYQLIFASGDSAATRAAWAHRQEHGRLAQGFARYIADWPVTRINREWDGFRAETLAILDAIAARTRGEEDTIYAHAERVRMRHAA